MQPTPITNFHNPQEFPEQGDKRFLTNREFLVLAGIGSQTPAVQELFNFIAPRHYHEGVCQWQPAALPLDENTTYLTAAPLDYGPIADERDFIAFVTSWDHLANAHHLLMIEKGFWDNRNKLREAFGDSELWPAIEGALDCQLLALITTETSEAVEAVRHGNPPDDKIPEFSGLAAEMADMVLRIMDLAHGKKIPLAAAIVAKLRMNATRAHKHGGKHF